MNADFLNGFLQCYAFQINQDQGNDGCYFFHVAETPYASTPQATVRRRLAPYLQKPNCNWRIQLTEIDPRQLRQALKKWWGEPRDNVVNHFLILLQTSLSFETFKIYQIRINTHDGSEPRPHYHKVWEDFLLYGSSQSLYLHLAIGE